jgi:hypothetical protein
MGIDSQVSWHYFYNCMGYTTLNGRMILNTELEMWKKVILTYFKILSQYFPGRAEENHKKQSG